MKLPTHSSSDRNSPDAKHRTDRGIVFGNDAMVGRAKIGAVRNEIVYVDSDEALPSSSKTQGRIVFIHSSFRTSSTWLWNAFRRLEDTCCYYEVFHESLASLRLEDVPNRSYDTWNSMHPVSAPYFREFSELFTADGGIRDFMPEMAYDSFIPADGIDGSLSDNEKAYIAGLINHALNKGQKPVLTCCRTLGRLKAIKREFGGWNIFLYRNLFCQWMSYLAQHYHGNSYFLHTVFRILEANLHDPFFSTLRTRYVSGKPGPFGGFHDIGSAFEAFVGFHLYLSMKAYAEADQVIEADRLADDQSYAGAARLTLIRQTGLNVDFSDAKRSVERLGNEPYVPDRLQDSVLQLLEDAAASLGYQMGYPAMDFGYKLASDLLSSEREHRIHTRGISKQLMEVDSKKQAMETELFRLNSLVAEMERKREATAAQLYQSESARQTLRDLQDILEPATKTMTWRLLKRIHPAWPRTLKQYLRR
ncbi:hypothetical protein RLW55_16320 [Hyphomicrobium sp. B1]|uniref:hypothetical protein n=1 Tax=Hyphomicrobium sp. B1 TaxID=3075651 RepID=UPI003C2C3E16